MTRQRDIEFSDLVRKRCPLMHEAIQHVGHRQTRNRGTIGGSLCHLDPSAELVTVAAAMDATVTVQGPNGTRQIEFAAFPVAFMTPAIELNELVTAVRFPAWPDGHGYGFVEFSRRHGDFAIVSAAALLTEDASGKITRASVTLGGIAVAPVRATEVEQALIGQTPDDKLLREACEACRSIRGARRHPRAGVLPAASRDRDVAPRAGTGARAAQEPCQALRQPMTETRKVAADRERQALRGRGRSTADARRFHPPHAGPDRHASRLRARRLRRLHHPARRHDRALLPDAGGAGRRPRDHHGRRARALGDRAAARCRRRSATITACNAASARRAC